MESVEQKITTWVLVGTFILLIILAIGLSIKDEEEIFCEAKGFERGCSDWCSIEPGYVECCGKYIDHKFDSDECEMFELE